MRSLSGTCYIWPGLAFNEDDRLWLEVTCSFGDLPYDSVDADSETFS